MAEIIGILTVPSTIIIYDGGFFSLDGGNTISTDTIGPSTQIVAAAGASISMALQNTVEVFAKLILVPGGSLAVVGPGSLTANNPDIGDPTALRIFGVRALRDITLSGSARLTGIGVDYGVASSSSTTGITVTGGSTLSGTETGVNTSLTSAARYGVFSSLGLVVSEGSAVTGTGVGTTSSFNTYGVYINGFHNETYPLHIVSGSVSGSADVGVYSGSEIIVDSGSLIGTGGANVTSHGVQADRTGIVVNAGATLSGACSGNGYAGVLATASSTPGIGGITTHGGTINGNGGIHGVRAAGSGSILVDEGGVLRGEGHTYGVICLNNNITVNGNATVTGVINGTGGRTAVQAGGDITATADSLVEGFTYAYGLDGSGYFGAVIANGNISASGDSEIVENYSRVEYYDEAFTLPYQNGKNMTDYRDYVWTISAGTGAVASDPGGEGIHATQSGTGTLTASRAGDVPGEVVNLDGSSTHTIHVPAVLTTTLQPEYHVTYDGNEATSGGVPNDGNNPYFEGDTVTVLGNVNGLEKLGSVFAGWALSPNGEGTIYQAGDTFPMPGEDVILYAVWAPLTYTVSYNPNGASSGAVPVDPNLYVAGSTVTVLGNTGNLMRQGYRFAGWATTPDGGAIYQSGETFEMPPYNVTLFAVWELIPIPPAPPRPCCICCKPCLCRCPCRCCHPYKHTSCCRSKRRPLPHQCCRE